MSNGGLALLGGISLLAIGIAAKRKIENLENEIRMLNSRVASLINEGDELKNTISCKDSEISQKNAKIDQLKEQLKKSKQE